MFNYFFESSPPNMNAFNIAILQHKLDEFYAFLDRFNGNYKDSKAILFPKETTSRYEQGQDTPLEAALRVLEGMQNKDTSVMDMPTEDLIVEAMQKAYIELDKVYKDSMPDTEEKFTAYSVIYHNIHMTKFEYRYAILLRHLRDYMDHYPHIIARHIDVSENGQSIRDAFDEINVGLIQSTVSRTARLRADITAAMLYNSASDIAKKHGMDQQNQSNQSIMGRLVKQDSENDKFAICIKEIQNEFTRTGLASGFHELPKRVTCTNTVDQLYGLDMTDITGQINKLIDMCSNVCSKNGSTRELKSADNAPERINRVRKLAREICVGIKFRNMCFLSLLICAVVFLSIHIEGFKMAAPHISIALMAASVILQSYIWYSEYYHRAEMKLIYGGDVQDPDQGNHKNDAEQAAQFMSLKDVSSPQNNKMGASVPSMSSPRRGSNI